MYTTISVRVTAQFSYKWSTIYLAILRWSSTLKSTWRSLIGWYNSGNGKLYECGAHPGTSHAQGKLWWQKGSWATFILDHQDIWTIGATTASTQLTSEALCMLSSILYCLKALGAITSRCCLLPVSYSGVHFLLGCTTCSSLSYKDFGMEHKISTASQRHNSSRIVRTDDISLLQNFMG